MDESILEVGLIIKQDTLKATVISTRDELITTLGFLPAAEIYRTLMHYFTHPTIFLFIPRKHIKNMFYFMS